MGKYCNQSCFHCHVEAGPGRKEIMERTTVDDVLRFLENSDIPTVDITGGAPELNPHFDYLVESCKGLGRHVMDRCNLTVFYEEDKEYLPEFFKRHRVEVVCSLPCYTKENVDSQRGNGTFELSVRGLQELNRLGYGQPDSGLELNLVYNPMGNYLPPPQEELEGDYRRMLGDDFEHRVQPSLLHHQHAHHPLQEVPEAARTIRRLPESFGRQLQCRNGGPRSCAGTC